MVLSGKILVQPFDEDVFIVKLCNINMDILLL